MAGTLRKRVNAVVRGTDEYLTIRDAYVVVYKWFEDHPGATLIANYFGDGAAGQDFQDGANPLGPQAWSCWRMDSNVNRPYPYYVFFQINGEASSFDGGVQLQGTTPSSSYGNFGISIARGYGGDENPWQGTTNANGADTKPTKFWDTPAGGTNTQVLPASNAPAGSDGTNRNNLLYCTQRLNSAFPLRIHIVGDDDSFVIVSWSRENTSPYVCAADWFEPAPGFTSYDWPMALYLDDNAGWTNTDTYTQDYTAGIAHPDSTELSNSSLLLEVCSINGADTAERHPNGETDRWDLFPIFYYLDQSGFEGIAGRSTLLQAVYAYGMYEGVGSGGEYLIVGSTSPIGYAIPYIVGEPIGGSTQAGATEP